MADNGELPSVGMECLVFMSPKDKKGCEGVIEFKNEQGCLFRYKSNNLCDYYSNDDGSFFNPLTPPVELIDGKAYQFDFTPHHNGTHIQQFMGIYDNEEREMCIAGETLPIGSCINIQPLTVKAK